MMKVCALLSVVWYLRLGERAGGSQREDVVTGDGRRQSDVRSTIAD